MEKLQLGRQNWFLVLVLTLGNLQLVGQNYSGLQNKPLPLVNNTATLSTQLFPEVNGAISRLFTRFDGEDQLKLVMQYAGYENTFIRAEVLDHDFKQQREIPVVTGQLSGQSNGVELVFSLSQNLPAGTKIRSSYVKITISKGPNYLGPHTPVRTYKLNKAWIAGSGEVAYSNQPKYNERTASSRTPGVSNHGTGALTRVTLNPIGSAGLLTDGKMKTPAKSIKSNRPTTSAPTPETNGEITTNRPNGPSRYKLSLWENIRADVDFKFDDISPISLELYQDVNLKSRHFYFIPSAFNLQWSNKGGYELKNLYGTAADEGQAGAVRMHATLTSGISTGEIAFIKRLLDASIPKNSLTTETSLKPLPINGAPKVNFTDELGSLYNIASDNVSVNVSSDISKPIGVSWSTDSRTRDEMAVALMEHVGINGAMVIEPMGDSLSSMRIPVNININDPKTFGQLNLDLKKWRSQHWVNPTPYPVQLNYLHVMMISEEGSFAPYIYSWDLGQQSIPVNGLVFFDAAKMPKWIDRAPNTLRAWLGYQILPCDACDRAAINSTLGGTSASLSQEITFELFDVVKQTGAQLIQIHIRSHQADPKGAHKVELANSLRITNDGTFTAGPLFIGSHQTPDFEYKLSLIMPDGTQYQADNWHRSNQLEVFLGIKNITDQLPTFSLNQEQ